MKTKKVVRDGRLTSTIRQFARSKPDWSVQEIMQQTKAVVGRMPSRNLVYALRAETRNGKPTKPKELFPKYPVKHAPSPSDIKKVVQRQKKQEPAKEPEPDRFTAEEVVLAAKVLRMTVTGMMTLFAVVGDRKRTESLIDMTMQALYPDHYAQGLFNAFEKKLKT